MRDERTLNRLAITQPAVRFYKHKQSIREDFLTTVKWMHTQDKRCIALGYRNIRQRTNFRLRFSNHRLWWDFK
jgi:hypothetical protein